MFGAFESSRDDLLRVVVDMELDDSKIFGAILGVGTIKSTSTSVQRIGAVVTPLGGHDNTSSSTGGSTTFNRRRERGGT